MSHIQKEAAEPASSGHCPCPPSSGNDNSNSPKPSGWLGSVFKKCAMCAGSGAGGLLAGHAGCIITPLVLMAAGATTATAGLSVIALAFSAAATAGGLYAWHRLRGQHAGTWEKRIVVGSALTGVLLSSALHIGRGQECHHDKSKPAITANQP